ncbi:MAG TPA: M20/M25/M40 family metallo-hydrolase [Thermomicrobiaceae bacterium]|nr:M20/M25/M40 family metallo-hydrolase [Thermomicrobiaceae bacterium]
MVAADNLRLTVVGVNTVAMGKALPGAKIADRCYNAGTWACATARMAPQRPDLCPSLVEGHAVQCRNPLLDRLRPVVRRVLPQVVDLTERVCMIPAPSYAEGERAAFVAAEFERRCLDVTVDEIGNVYACRRGRGNAPALMFAAHTDTVFPAGTPIQVERQNGRLTGPSIGDNSLGVASILGLADVLIQSGVETAGDIVLVANVGEEGLGNLRGIRAAVERFDGDLGAVVAVEGHDLGRVTHRGVGSRRIRVTVTGPGGHSWGAFGQPSAIHELGLIIAEFTRLRVPVDPKTTFNVGLIEGGVSVNTIAPSATAVVDMRSVSEPALRELSDEVERIVECRRSGAVETRIDVLGERPAGEVSPSAPIVRAAVEVLAALGIDARLNVSSTDANIPIARGIPAICVGVTRGTGAHRLDETIEIAPIESGLLQLALLAEAFPVDDGKLDSHVC